MANCILIYSLLPNFIIGLQQKVSALQWYEGDEDVI
jgi:hypothetical protein